MKSFQQFLITETAKKKKPPEHELEKFILGPERNKWLKYKKIDAYYRKGHRFINEVKYKVIERANTTNRGPLRKGTYSELTKVTEHLAKKHGYDGVYIENVLNEFLPDALKRHGYTHVNKNDVGIGGAPCFFKKV